MIADASLIRAIEDPHRLDLLNATQLLDSPPEEAFDRFTRLASTILHAPVALISLVDKERQFFKSQYGLEEPMKSKRETPLSHSFCKHLVGTAMPLIVADARDHPLLRNNPAVQDLQVIAYLGVPLQTPGGQTLGAFCTIDAKPREWSEQEVTIMKDLGIWVMTEIQLRLLGRHFMQSYLKVRDLELQRDELTHMLVHDLRNPLHSLMAGLELVEANGGLDTKGSEYVSIARNSALSLLNMVNDILDVNKAEAGRMRLNVDLHQPRAVVEEACLQLQAMAYQAGVSLIKKFTENLPSIAIDREKVRRVLVNLISNAIQHTPNGGKILVSATYRKDGPLVLEVADNGFGIANGAFGQIFEKFGSPQNGQGKGHRVSTGLGLPFCKKAIDAHGGYISVESELGKGTTFRVEIPYPPVAATQRVSLPQES